jgi:predicted SAM-dependent methyltransferase
MKKKTELNQLLSSVKHFTYPNRIANRFINRRRVRDGVRTAKFIRLGTYLNLGCGPNIYPDFCNLDFRWHDGVNVCWDVTEGLPFEDERLGGIFSEHMLEHIGLDDALALLKECKRVLQLGGILRLIVPDGELCLAEYAKHLSGSSCYVPDEEHSKKNGEFITPMVNVNKTFYCFDHMFTWDYETLRSALLRCGFSKVERRCFGEGSDSKLIQDTLARNCGSLYVEAS